MEIENKLDEDFLFYLTFINPLLKRISNQEVHNKCRQWLNKLCGETCNGIQKKRCRNIYLSRLLACMQTANLDAPFQQIPAEVNILDATQVFDPVPEEIEQPAWLEDSFFTPHSEVPQGGGRTYVATRTLPDGQGAFAYIGISMEDEDQMWMGGGEGATGFDEHLQAQFAEQVPVYEMEKILAKRKDPAEREKVLAFYDVLLQCVADEIDGENVTENETVEGLLEQLINDLKEQDLYGAYEVMGDFQRRMELLLILYDRVKTRREKVAKREELLDDIEQKLTPPSMLETSVQPEDKYEFPAAMWEQAINRVPTKKQMERLQGIYPIYLIQKFLTLLSDHKEEIAMRMQRRHENMVTQMKKELRKEGDKKKVRCEEAQTACERAMAICKVVKEHYKKLIDAEEKNREKLEIPVADHTKKYEALKKAVFDTQKLVEEEAQIGKFLASQIHDVSNQTEQIKQVNISMVEKTEEANSAILRNIKRLSAAVRLYEKRINDMQTQVEAAGSKAQSDVFFF